MKQIFTLLSLAVFSTQSLAAAPGSGPKVLLAPQSVDVQEYKGALIAMDQVISPTEWHLKSTPRIESIEALTTAYARAEQTFLDGSDLSAASSAFEIVTQFENRDDWDSSQRKLLLTSYLRLLQIDQSPQNPKRKTWIQKALVLMKQTEIAAELIPPPLVRELELYNSTWSTNKWAASQKARSLFSHVLILGQKFSLSEQISLPEFSGKIRVTFLSDFQPAVTREMDQTDFQEYEPAQNSYVSGTCGDWAVSPKPTFEYEVYTPRSCAKAERPVPAQALAKSAPGKAIEIPMEVPQSKTSWKMPEKKWLWVGLGVVATALAVHQVQNSQKKNNQPTETYGF